MIDNVTKEIIKRCQRSPSFFLDNFGKIQHPKLGLIPFKLFSYQKKCLQSFLDNRLTIFKKTRQSGISTITGGFALWYAMFFNKKTILIVSKRDLDAMDFLRKNVRMIYDNLPDWMRELWPLSSSNEHEISFPNGSRIRSLTSSKETLRSHASSLNIIDEAAFIDHMDEMWAAGAPSIMHGGSLICISTVKGIGNWYWQTWTDAEAGLNNFKPITINWWDMDWSFEYKDELSGQNTIISPCRGIRQTTPEETAKFGKYWSPWLDEQYRQLTQKGDYQKFLQEIRCEFLGTGNTVIDAESLQHVMGTVDNNYKVLKTVDYVNPNTEERSILDFDGKLWIWNEPVRSKPLDIRTGQQYDPGHTYVMGADTSSGEAGDYSTIEVFDMNTQEQVAELQIRTSFRTFAQMADFIGRWYNNAFLVVESTGIGKTICQELNNELMYQNLYRRPKKDAFNKASKYGDVGFNTGPSTKPFLVKALCDNIGAERMLIKSNRLVKELTIYVHLKNSKTGAEPGKGNNDDLVMATGLAFVGMNLATMQDMTGLVPVRSMEVKPESHDAAATVSQLQQVVQAGGPSVLLPVLKTDDDAKAPMSIAQELGNFAKQLGGIPIDKGKMSTVNPQKHIIRYKK